MKAKTRFSYIIAFCLTTTLFSGSCVKDTCCICTKTADTPPTFPGGTTINTCSDSEVRLFEANGYDCVAR